MADLNPADVPDHASEIAIGSKLSLDTTKKLPGEDFRRPWPPLIKMDAAVKARMVTRSSRSHGSAVSTR